MSMGPEQEKEVIKLLERSDTFLRNYMIRFLEKHGTAATVAFAGNLGSHLVAFTLMLTYQQNKNVQQMLDLLMDRIEHRYDNMNDDVEHLKKFFSNDTCRPLH